jgi:hypothetical protein
MADDILKEALDAFEICQAHEAENREEALEDIRFARLGEQWPQDVQSARLRDGRPCLTINVLPPYIRQVVNDARQNRPAITVHPASDGADQEVAQIYNGLIRNIEVTSDADVAYDTAIDCAVTSGLGYFRINTCYSDDDSFQTDLAIQAIPNPFSVWGDPYSTAADSADWNSAFVIDMSTKSSFKKKHKGADAVDWESNYTGLASPWFDDDMVMLAEFWKREETERKIAALTDGTITDMDVFQKNLASFQAAGVELIGQTRTVKSHKVTQYLMTGAEVLETTPWAGKYIPIVPVYGEVVNLEGRRFLRSLVRGSRDAQRNLNYNRSLEVELGALAPKTPFIGPKGAFATDADKWETANTESHAFIEYDGAQPPQRQQYAGPPAGAIQGAMNAQADLKTVIGLFDASMGQAQANAQAESGRAILARMREGDVSTFHFVDNLSRAIRHAGRILIDLIPHVYSTPRMIRVMGQDGTPSMTPVNQPVVPAPQPQGAPQVPGQQTWLPAPQPPALAVPAQPPAGPMGLPMQGADPLTQPQVIEKVFDLTVGKYGLTVEAGPSFTTRREEAAQQMITLAQADPSIMPVIGDLLVKNLDWPGADEIAQRLVQMRQQQQAPKPGQPPQGQGDIAKAQMEGQIKQQQLQQEGQLKAQQLQQQMQLERMKMLGQFQLEREKMQWQQRMDLQEAQFDEHLAAETARASIALKGAEVAHRADQTVSLPDTTINDRIG